jgi:hypothetical protein
LISLAQDRDKWCAVVNMVTNLQGPKMHVISSLADELLASERLCFI